MMRRPPRSTRTDTLFPYPTLFRSTESLGRSHRAKIGKTRLQYCIDLMREMLQLPATHRIGIVPGSDTGAFEMAMLTMLGARPVTTLAWESFGEGWVTDAAKQLQLISEERRVGKGSGSTCHSL